MEPLIAIEYGNGDGTYDHVSMGGGAWLPDRFRVRLDNPSRPLVSTIDFIVRDATVEVLRVTQVPRPGHPVGSDDFRIPIGRVIDTAITALMLRGPERPAGTYLKALEVLGATPPTGPTVGHVLRLRRRRVLTPELLAEVAQVYATARAQGVRVRAAIADRWRIPENTARNWIAAARRAGLL